MHNKIKHYLDGWNLVQRYTELPPLFYREQLTTSAPEPKMVLFNHKLAQSMGLNASTLEQQPALFSGNILPPNAKPIAQAYAGHQFGYLSVLGDGRAVLLGEQVTPDGQHVDVQLKGAGQTPFSRRGDGLAALGPMLREYIISEAMYHLRIPTTRSLAVVLSGKDVMRERRQLGAVLTRIAASHVRVGTFEFASSQGMFSDLKALADYCIEKYFPALNDGDYLGFLREVAQRQAVLIAKWQLVGFVHGVMNTDNVSIVGETIDYGPCAFLDVYNPSAVFSGIDTEGRYAYNNQPKIGAWNLARFAEALLPLLDNNIAAAQAEIDAYHVSYRTHWLTGMYSKLGIINPVDSDASLVNDLLNLMSQFKLDYTATMRALSEGRDVAELQHWQEHWQRRASQQPCGVDAALDIMKQNNPAVIARNNWVEHALSQAENGNLSSIKELLSALENPYERSEKLANITERVCNYKTSCGT